VWIAGCDVVVENLGREPARVAPESFWVAAPYVPEPDRTTLQPVQLTPGESVRARLAFRVDAMFDRPKRLRVAFASTDRTQRPTPVDVAIQPGTDDSLRAGWLGERDRLAGRLGAGTPTIAYLTGQAIPSYYGDRVVRFQISIRNDTREPLTIARASFSARIDGERLTPLPDDSKNPLRSLQRQSTYCPSSPVPREQVLRPGDHVMQYLCVGMLPSAEAPHDAILAYVPDPRFPRYARVPLNPIY
jgi:hypothetical protein